MLFSTDHPSFFELKQSLQRIQTKDVPALIKKLNQLKSRQKQKKPSDKLFASIYQAFLDSYQHVQTRERLRPNCTFSEHLPVNQKLDDIKNSIAVHQVVIVCGETGSGKTTQLPKICLELGRGIRGRIGHTQPRRIAARAVAQRIAQELNSNIGELVGFKIRFTDRTAPNALIKLMTDGILLAETQTDPLLSQYDTIIIDEAHERSLNIDFLLGYLKKILPQRPDLKLIITSATIDAQLFSQHFQNAPIIEVSGRTFPVEILYRPLKSRDEDQVEEEMEAAIIDVAQELLRHERGDILVFLPGEREIRETLHQFRKAMMDVELLPLFSRLSQEEQNRIFQPHERARIILATNVAETSLTIPNIRYVIDTGLARVKRYAPRARIEQLHIEKISQAAARQRSGRCGRVEAGICVRLYDETDFAARPEFTDPEIVRSNLAAVILRMAQLNLGNVHEFPFVETPSNRLIADGFTLLYELGALDEQQHLTQLGKSLAMLPVDPKIGRMLLAAKELNCLTEILIISAALSIQDPRERPFDSRDTAEKAHAKFAHERSDFLSFLNLWQFFQKEDEEKQSNRKLIQRCHEHFLSYLRLREWRELHQQLQKIMLDIGCRLNETPATYEQIHRALLSGLISQIGLKSISYDYYQGAKNLQFYIFPNSSLKKQKPKWLLAGELIETSKVYARHVAHIDPEWVESIAPHLIKFHYFDPHWDKERGDVLANQKITLYGLPIVQKRIVSYGKFFPKEARELFIRQALVTGNHQIKANFFVHNQKLIKEIETLEHKSRRQDVLVNEETLFEFYDAQLPETIHNQANFEHWIKHISADSLQTLFLSKEYLMKHSADFITEAQFPEFLKFNDIKIKLNYRFEPHHILDGITANLPLSQLNQFNKEAFEWLVPGMIREKINLLIKGLPKQVRRNCVPHQEFVTKFLMSELNLNLSLNEQLAKFIKNETKQDNVLQLIDLIELPQHLLMNFRIIDEKNKELGLGRDFLKLKETFSEVAQLSFRENVFEFEREHIEQWDFGKLPNSLNFAQGRQQLVGYPALTIEKEHLAIRLFDTEHDATHAHQKGVVFLIQKQLKEQLKQLKKGLPHNFTQTALAFRTIVNKEQLLDDAILAIFNRAVLGNEELPRDEKTFIALKDRVRVKLPSIIETLSRVLNEIALELNKISPLILKHPLEKEIKQHLQQLIYPNFLSQTHWEQLINFPRYLRAIILRIQKYAHQPLRDKKHQIEINQLSDIWLNKIKQNQKEQKIISNELVDFKWHIEELKVSLFAQELKTPYPVSIKRLYKIWETLK